MIKSSKNIRVNNLVKFNVITFSELITRKNVTIKTISKLLTRKNLHR